MAVERDGTLKQMEFKKVSPVSVHPTYDLALLKINLPAGATLRTLKKSPRKIVTGQRCYVIGNPGDTERALKNSISDGLVSAAQREIDGLAYIQTTAAINPGNSGGAMVDSRGSLVGIVTFIITDTEGIGSAIPMSLTHSKDFVRRSERKSDFKKGKAYEDKGAYWCRLSFRLRDEEREVALFLAYLHYRLSLAEMPNHFSPYHNVASCTWPQ